MSASCCRQFGFQPWCFTEREISGWVLPKAGYLAEHIPGAKLVELPGEDHIPWWGDQERLIGEIQAFLTGARAIPPTDRVLLTLLVTDIVDSTEKAAAIGDLKWKGLLQSHDAAVRRELKNFDGQEINTTGEVTSRVVCPGPSPRMSGEAERELGRSVDER